MHPDTSGGSAKLLVRSTIFWNRIQAGRRAGVGRLPLLRSSHARGGKPKAPPVKRIAAPQMEAAARSSNHLLLYHTRSKAAHLAPRRGGVGISQHSLKSHQSGAGGQSCNPILEVEPSLPAMSLSFGEGPQNGCSAGPWGEPPHPPTENRPNLFLSKSSVAIVAAEAGIPAS